MGRLNVYELLQERLNMIFSQFDNVYVSFSGGKDSGVLLNICIDYIRANGLKTKLGVFHMDYEVQYKHTTDYVLQTFEENKDILEVYHVCVPFKVPTCASMYQTYWRPWDDSIREQWVREMPEACYTKDDFPFFTDQMWDYEFQSHFVKWLHYRKKARRTCCMVGIRTQESINRWRAIHNDKHNMHRFRNLRWTRYVSFGIYNAYPLFDWQTTDVWVANGRFGYSYNKLYDLYYKAGLKIEKQRVASPFISEARGTLLLYRVIDPDMWGKMVNRVNGVNFSGMYAGTHAVGWMEVKLPEGFTWESYMYFLLSTLPEQTRNNYLEKLAVSVKFWREKGGGLSDAAIEKLHNLGVQFTLAESPYQTTKKAVRMEYLDDIRISEFKDIPTFKRICVCILKNDHSCKYMGFLPNKTETQKRQKIMDKYRGIF